MKVNVDKEKVIASDISMGQNDISMGQNDISMEQNDTSVGQNDISMGQNNISTGQNDIDMSENIKTNTYKCSKCHKILHSKKRLRGHEEKCDGTHILQCKICLKMFASQQGKSKHKLNVKCSPPAITTAITTTNNMNNNNISIDKSTNNNNITNNNFNLIKADFGKENLDKMYRDPNYFKNIADNIEMGRYAIPKTIEFIYFNDDYPENQTLKKDRRNDKLVSIHQKGKWQTRMFEDVQNDILRQSEEYHKSYLQNLEETVDTTVKDKKFKERMLPVACFLRIMKENGWSCADVKNIGVNLDYEMDDEDYKRMLSCKKEMELLMLDKIHEETTVMYHNTSVAQNALE